MALKEIPPVEVNITVDGNIVQSKLHEDLIVGEGDLNIHIDECSARFAY